MGKKRQQKKARSAKKVSTKPKKDQNLTVSEMSASSSSRPVGPTTMKMIPIGINMFTVVRFAQKASFRNCVIQMADETVLGGGQGMWMDPTDALIMEAHFFDLDDTMYVLTKTDICQYFNPDIAWVNEITGSFLKDWNEKRDRTRDRLILNTKSFVSRYLIMTHDFSVKISCTHFFDEKLFDQY